MDNSSETFCIYPWSYLFQWPNGNLHTCCDGSIVLGKATDSYLDKLQSPVMNDIRKKMLDGEWHKNCENCRLKEQKGFKSSRITANYLHSKTLLPKIGDLSSEGFLENPKIFLMELRLSNLCNLKCRTCDHNSSSAWFEDERALTGQGLLDRYPDKKILNSNIDIESLSPSLEHILKIEFAGGEPFLDSRVEKILYQLIDMGRHNEVLVSFITNFTQIQPDNPILQLVQKFQNRNFVISLDGMGPRAEYIRSGTHWASIEKNLDYFLEHFSDNSFFNIHCTYSIFNAFHIIDFHRWITEDKQIPKHKFAFNLALGPEHITADIIPIPIKKDLIQLYRDYQNSWLDVPKNRIRSTFDGAITYLSKSRDNSNHHLAKFFEHVDFLDLRRNECFEEVFPEWKNLRNYL